ncbi:RlpA-like double-psi beta-barrel-protein domain-containing protein-containing protein [Lineolata rhizophorae]|uniref:RlpA-like double-psi beta-barrel-protein domain-containing protein-containing protein n=1 Tax=Lineolata rhizophorae TaxID=578093 RepID=A0A6A6NUS7_9PEZI|nr:RlpA-like double-psi beta-barrel-protein domain-containing protein-containing protein [Lineolata rhizophorae]
MASLPTAPGTSQPRAQAPPLPPKAPPEKPAYIIEWEVPEGSSAKSATSSLRNALLATFDRVFPPYRTYFGRSRRTFLVIMVAIFAALLGLVIGLAVGLPGNCPAPSPPSAAPSDNTTPGTIISGEMTYYSPGVGACGQTHGAADLVVATSHARWTAANPNADPECGRRVRVQRGGASVELVVVDKCTGCAVDNVDVSPTAFQQLGDLAEGRVNVEWSYR